MPGYTQVYDHKSVGDYEANTGIDGLNAITIEYYGSDDKKVRVETTNGSTKYTQTISGSDYAQQWPSYTYSITYAGWEVTTVS
jgi:hypothetical protein